MQEPFSLFNQQTYFDIQPVLPDRMLFQVFFIASISLLGLIGLLRMLFRAPLLEHPLQFLLSEEYAFSRFITQPLPVLLGLLLLSFAALQFVFFLITMSWQLLLLASGICFAFFVLRLGVYYTLQYLHPQVDVRYYLFNYAHFIFFVSIILFCVHCYQYTVQGMLREYIMLAGLLLFTILLLIRWLFISLRYQVVSSLYFLLYFCTLEIAPLIIIIHYYQ